MHRDIKLENVLMKKRDIASHRLVTDFEFKIADMGLAKQHMDSNICRQTICGTPMYMAPELLNSEPYNSKADVWSVGTLLFNLLTGVYPFGASNMNDLKSNVRKGEYSFPPELRLSTECTNFVQSCL